MKHQSNGVYSRSKAKGGWSHQYLDEYTLFVASFGEFIFRLKPVHALPIRVRHYETKFTISAYLYYGIRLMQKIDRADPIVQQFLKEFKTNLITETYIEFQNPFYKRQPSIQIQLDIK